MFKETLQTFVRTYELIGSGFLANNGYYKFSKGYDYLYYKYMHYYLILNNLSVYRVWESERERDGFWKSPFHKTLSKGETLQLAAVLLRRWVSQVMYYSVKSVTQD